MKTVLDPRGRVRGPKAAQKERQEKEEVFQTVFSAAALPSSESEARRLKAFMDTKKVEFDTFHAAWNEGIGQFINMIMNEPNSLKAAQDILSQVWEENIALIESLISTLNAINSKYIETLKISEGKDTEIGQLKGDNELLTTQVRSRDTRKGGHVSYRNREQPSEIQIEFPDASQEAIDDYEQRQKQRDAEWELTRKGVLEQSRDHAKKASLFLDTIKDLADSDAAPKEAEEARNREHRDLVDGVKHDHWVERKRMRDPGFKDPSLPPEEGVAEYDEDEEEKEDSDTVREESYDDEQDSNNNGVLDLEQPEDDTPDQDQDVDMQQYPNERPPSIPASPTDLETSQTTSSFATPSSPATSQHAESTTSSKPKKKKKAHKRRNRLGNYKPPIAPTLPLSPTESQLKTFTSPPQITSRLPSTSLSSSEQQTKENTVPKRSDTLSGTLPKLRRPPGGQPGIGTHPVSAGSIDHRSLQSRNWQSQLPGPFITAPPPQESNFLTDQILAWRYLFFFFLSLFTNIIYFFFPRLIPAHTTTRTTKIPETYVWILAGHFGVVANLCVWWALSSEREVWVAANRFTGLYTREYLDDMAAGHCWRYLIDTKYIWEFGYSYNGVGKNNTSAHFLGLGSGSGS